MRWGYLFPSCPLWGGSLWTGYVHPPKVTVAVEQSSPPSSLIPHVLVTAASHCRFGPRSGNGTP